MWRGVLLCWSVIVCRTRNCIVKPRELRLGRSNIVFSHLTCPILVPVSNIVENFRERNMAFRSAVKRVRPGKGISPVFRNLHIVHKLRRFNFHRIKENAGVKGRLQCTIHANS